MARFLNKKGELGPPTVILFFVSRKFTPGTADIKVGWPQGYTIVIDDDIIR